MTDNLKNEVKMEVSAIVAEAFKMGYAAGKHDEIERLRARVAELEDAALNNPDNLLRDDAARYRWLRDPKRSHSVVGSVVDNTGVAAYLKEYALDRAIDAARGEK